MLLVDIKTIADVRPSAHAKAGNRDSNSVMSISRSPSARCNGRRCAIQSLENFAFAQSYLLSAVNASGASGAWSVRPASLSRGPVTGTGIASEQAINRLRQMPEGPGFGSGLEQAFSVIAERTLEGVVVTTDPMSPKNRPVGVIAQTPHHDVQWRYAEIRRVDELFCSNHGAFLSRCCLR